MKTSPKQKKNVKNLENFTTGKTMIWNEEKTKSCTDKPPISETPETCTTDGCNKPVWYIDGELCGYSQEEFDACRRKKTNAACQAEKDELATDKATTKTIDGDQTLNCTETLWYFEGQDTGSAEAWKALMCEKNKKDLLGTIHSGSVKYCDISPIYIIGGKEILPFPASRDDAKTKFDELLAENNEARCTQSLNADAVGRGDGGEYTSPTPSGISAPVPADCGLKYWYCKDKIHRSKADFDADTRCQRTGPPPWYCPWEPNAPGC